MNQKNKQTNEQQKQDDKTMFFYVDFESWVVQAATQEEAEKKAIARLKTGYIPGICNLDDVGDTDRIAEDWGEGWYIRTDEKVI